MRTKQRAIGRSDSSPLTGNTSERTLRISTVLAVPAVLRSLGEDPIAILAEIGLDLHLFDDPDNLISVSMRGRLMAHCAMRSRCPYFGLLVGQQAGLQSFGIVGLLVKSAPDVGTALSNLVRFFFLQARGATLSLEVQADMAELSYKMYASRLDGTEQIGDGALALAFNVLQQLCGPGWKGVEVRFAHHRPTDVEPYRRFFRAPLQFDAEHYSVVFSAGWLAHPLPATDPLLTRLIQEQISKLEQAYGNDFPEHVRTVLRHAVGAGNATADRVAAVFAIERRTLTRRLNPFGTSFQALVDEVRFEIARQLLEDSRMEIIQIASMLDYVNASAFTRAFRRWSGTTPAKWRVNREARRSRIRNAT